MYFLFLSQSVCLQCDHWVCWNWFTWGNFPHHTDPSPPICSNLFTWTSSHRAPLKSSALTGKRVVGLRLNSLLIFKFDKHWKVQSDVNSNDILVNLPCHGKVDLCQESEASQDYRVEMERRGLACQKDLKVNFNWSLIFFMNGSMAGSMHYVCVGFQLSHNCINSCIPKRLRPTHSRLPFLTVDEFVKFEKCDEKLLLLNIITNIYLWLLLVKFMFQLSCLF